jgi:hypothetical protein
MRVDVQIIGMVDFGALPAAFQEVGMQGLVTATELVAGTAQANAPVDRGIFRGAIEPSQYSTSQMEMVGEVRTTGAQYASVIEMVDENGNPVEYGRRPGTTPPPISIIQAWVERKGLVEDITGTGKTAYAKLSGASAARSLAFAIAKSIAARGLPRQNDDRFRPIGRAREQHEGDINQIFTVDVPAKLRERLAG